MPDAASVVKAYEGSAAVPAGTVSWPEFKAKAVKGEVVPMPMLPPLVTIKFVAVEEPMANCGEVPNAVPELTERNPQGEVVPMPMLPLLSILNLSCSAAPAVLV